jgi:tRNA G37 N-methylase TrmD
MVAVLGPMRPSPIIYIHTTQQYFPAAWKEAAVVPEFKRGNHAAVNNYRLHQN